MPVENFLDLTARRFPRPWSAPLPPGTDANTGAFTLELDRLRYFDPRPWFRRSPTRAQLAREVQRAKVAAYFARHTAAGIPVLLTKPDKKRTVAALREVANAKLRQYQDRLTFDILSGKPQ